VQRDAGETLDRLEHFTEHGLVRRQNRFDVRLIRDVSSCRLLFGIRVENSAILADPRDGQQAFILRQKIVAEEALASFVILEDVPVPTKKLERLSVVRKIIGNSLGRLSGKDFLLGVKLVNGIIPGAPIGIGHEVGTQQRHS
jgi:hypothetical protein